MFAGVSGQHEGGSDRTLEGGYIRDRNLCDRASNPLIGVGAVNDHQLWVSSDVGSYSLCGGNFTVVDLHPVGDARR